MAIAEKHRLRPY